MLWIKPVTNPRNSLCSVSYLVRHSPQCFSCFSMLCLSRLMLCLSRLMLCLSRLMLCLSRLMLCLSRLMLCLSRIKPITKRGTKTHTPYLFIKPMMSPICLFLYVALCRHLFRANEMVQKCQKTFYRRPTFFWNRSRCKKGAISGFIRFYLV